MYNFRGIYYQMKSSVMLFIVLGVVFLILSKCWNADKRSIKEMIIGVVCIVLAIVSVIYYSFIINNPKISVHEGYYVSENRANTHILKMEYCFSNGEDIKPIFYLDVLTKKKIYPQTFDVNQKYRIYYEEESFVIVKVEEIQ